MKYYQCELSNGTTHTRAYIEARGAKIGAKVEIKDSNFTGLWTVDQVADKGVDEDYLKNLQDMNRNSFGSIEKRESY